MRPLEGKRILVTRAEEQARPFSNEIADRGGTPIEVPVIAIRTSENQTEIHNHLSRLSEYKDIVFTSANGVRFFFNALTREGVSFPAHSRISVVGKKTEKVLRLYGYEPDIVPDEFVADSLLDVLKHEINPGEKVLLPRGNLARNTIPDTLAEWGADVTDLTVYESVLNEESRLQLNKIIREKQADVVTFTSSSTVRYFFNMLGGCKLNDLLDGVLFACIGPITANTLLQLGYVPDILPDEYTTRSLLDKIEHFFKEAQP